MKFKDLKTPEVLMAKIQRLNKDATCHPMWGTIFLQITPNQDKSLLLAKEYKPHNFMGTITEYHQKQRHNDSIVRKAEAKLRQHNFYGQHYDNSEASLKFHLNLNDIGELDEKIVLGLIKLLIEEANSETNGIKFFFKIISPEYHTNERFKDTDQLTIYFDKYSSLGDMVRLSKKINDYLSDKIPENKIKLGPKDSFGFNSFVSARFDTNKLLAEYCEYPFFDLELKKFFERNQMVGLNDIPVGALEAVFNTVLTSEVIQNLGNRQNKELSEADSQLVQQEFDKMLDNPKNYLSSQKENTSIKEGQEKEKDQINLIKRNVYNVDLDFRSCQSTEQIQDRLALKQEELGNYAASLQRLQENSGKVDTTIYNTVLEVIAQKNVQLQKAAEEAERLKNSTRPRVEEANTAPRLNPRAVINFKQLLDKIKDKGDKLPESENKKQVALTLYEDLNNEFEDYKTGSSTFDDFKKNCDRYIRDARPTLEIHRDGGWKELFVNILKSIASLGLIPLYNYCKSDGNYFFSKVNTDSINKVEKVAAAIDTLQEDTQQLNNTL